MKQAETLSLLRGCAHEAHDVRRRPAFAQLFRHELHVWVDVVEEVLVPRAKIVQARVSIWSMDEAMLRAFPVARKPDIAFSAHARQQIAFRRAERFLLI